MDALIESLNESAQSLVELASECPPDQAVQRPDENAWSVRHVVCHITDTERLIFRPRMQKLIDATDEPDLPSIDHETWEADHNYAAKDFRQAMKEFLEARAATVEMLRAAPADALDKTGQHDIRGRITLADVIQYTVDHTRIHEAQISRTMAAVSQLPSSGEP